LSGGYKLANAQSSIDETCESEDSNDSDVTDVSYGWEDG